jgi:hypothetical protein
MFVGPSLAEPVGMKGRWCGCVRLKSHNLGSLGLYFIGSGLHFTVCNFVKYLIQPCIFCLNSNLQ